MATLAKRRPTVCTSLPSWTSSRSLLPLSTLPLAICSASSEPAERRTFRLCEPGGSVVEVVLVEVDVLVEVVVVVGGGTVLVVVVVGGGAPHGHWLVTTTCGLMAAVEA